MAFQSNDITQLSVPMKIDGGMVWYGMYDTPRHMKIPSLLVATSFSLLCTFVSSEVATPFGTSTRRTFESVLPSP